MKKKHRHKWILGVVNDVMLGTGLLYSCMCGKCKKYKDKEPRAKELEQIIYDLLNEKYNNKFTRRTTHRA